MNNQNLGLPTTNQNLLINLDKSKFFLSFLENPNNYFEAEDFYCSCIEDRARFYPNTMNFFILIVMIMCLISYVVFSILNLTIKK